VRPRLTRAVAAVLAAAALAGAALDDPAGATTVPPTAVAWVATHAVVSDPGGTIVRVTLPAGSRNTGPSRITTASQPTAMALTPNGRRLLVVNEGANSLSVVDVADGEVVATVFAGIQPDAVAVAPGGTDGAGVALVADFGSGRLTPIDLATLRAGPSVGVGDAPDAVAVADLPSGEFALVADFADATVHVVDVATMRAGPAIAVGTEPDAVAVIGGSPPLALVADFGSDALTPIDLSTFRSGSPVPVAGDPTGVVTSPDGTFAWVAGGGALTPFKLAGLQPGIPVSLRSPAEALTLAGPSGTTAWVAEENGWLVPVPLPGGPPGHGVYVGGHPTSVVIVPAAR